VSESGAKASHHDEVIELRRLLLAQTVVLIGEQVAPYFARAKKKRAAPELSPLAKALLWDAAVALLLENSCCVDKASSPEEAA